MKWWPTINQIFFANQWFTRTLLAAVFKDFIARSSTVASRLLLDVFVDGVPWSGNVSEAIPGWWTLIVSLACTSILYPGGRKVLKPTIKSGCPLKRFDTRFMTPGVSILKFRCYLMNHQLHWRQTKFHCWWRQNRKIMNVFQLCWNTFQTKSNRSRTFAIWTPSLCQGNHCRLVAGFQIVVSLGPSMTTHPQPLTAGTVVAAVVLALRQCEAVLWEKRAMINVHEPISIKSACTSKIAFPSSGKVSRSPTCPWGGAASPCAWAFCVWMLPAWWGGPCKFPPGWPPWFTLKFEVTNFKNTVDSGTESDPHVYSQHGGASKLARNFHPLCRCCVCARMFLSLMVLYRTMPKYTMRTCTYWKPWTGYCKLCDMTDFSALAWNAKALLLLHGSMWV